MLNILLNPSARVLFRFSKARWKEWKSKYDDDLLFQVSGLLVVVVIVSLSSASLEFRRSKPHVEENL